MSRIPMALFAFALAALSTGCVTRAVVNFEDNLKSPVTALEVLKTENYLFFAKRTHQFYMCQDTGDKLVCKLSCDGKNDVVCPQGQAGYGGAGSNVR
ncbi:hypothetical protein [Polyangium jinanense]|uniref:Lipoprotein n=1 Tax=Polyangium jinanense TaxID=2829994 RepID=A0A9X3X6C0_9BACT|nr:hypothetical protein [Polyangium jinanense]MDC3955644.1 hypothetical protein [Polyangium jinanense]MDC3982286.1 hypothetical protein [Polyangium jinanense]